MEKNSSFCGDSQENISNQNTVVDTDIMDVAMKLISENSDTEDVKKVLANVKGTKRHHHSHTEEKPYVCIYCDKTFMKSSNLKEHLITHPGYKIFACKKCKARFSNWIKLLEHSLTHLGKKPHMYKSQAVSGDTKLKELFLALTGRKLDRCEVCHKTFSIKSDFFNHLASHLHADDDACYFCKICLHCFPNVSSLKLHLSNHTVEKPYGTIDECPPSKKFKQFLAYLKERKPYECEACNKKFVTNSDLTKHLRFHIENEKPYGCIVCREPFAKISDLNAHLQTHPVEKSYGCDSCVKRFSDQSQLKRHIPTHSVVKPCD